MSIEEYGHNAISLHTHLSYDIIKNLIDNEEEKHQDKNGNKDIFQKRSSLTYLIFVTTRCCHHISRIDNCDNKKESQNISQSFTDFDNKLYRLGFEVVLKGNKVDKVDNLDKNQC